MTPLVDEWLTVERLRGRARRLPRKRMGAGALLRDADGRVLLVDPTYKPQWELPGGAVEAGESPFTACRRELMEELGLDLAVGRALVIDWVPPAAGRTEGLMLVYDGGVLSEADIAAIALPPEELAAYAFVGEAELGEYLTPLLARRVAASLDAARTGTVLSLEDGRGGPGAAPDVARPSAG